MALASLRVPAIITCSIIFFVLGIGAGTSAMSMYGYHWQRESGERPAGSGDGGGAPKGMPGMGGPGMPGMGGPGMPGMPGGAGKGKQGPNSKAQLEALVLKLEQLTTKPLQVSLNDEQKKKVREQIKGLNEMKELSEDDAKKRFDALIDILKDQKDTMEAAGYRWPGAGGGFGGGGFGGQKKKEADNPFKEGKTEERLKALEAALAKG